jgi:hypothetical protein
VGERIGTVLRHGVLITRRPDERDRKKETTVSTTRCDLYTLL